MIDVTAYPEVFSVLPDDQLFIVRNGQGKRIAGKYLNSGSGGGSLLAVGGGLFCGGSLNTAPVQHVMTGAGVSGRPLTMPFIVQVPPLSQIPSGGRCIGGIAAQSPTGSILSSIILGIRGAGGGFGNPPPVSKAGDLICRATNSGGGDTDMVVPDFCTTYAGKTVRIDFVRGLTASDWPTKLLVNGVQVIPGVSGSSTNFGVNLGSNPVFFYGSQGSARPWMGPILAAGVATIDYTADDILGMGAPTPAQLDGVAWGSFISNRDQDCADSVGFSWDNWTGDGAAYSKSGGGTVTPTPGDANSWAHGEVHGVTAPNKLRVTASGSTKMNRAVKTGGTRGYAYRLTIKARYVTGSGSGTARPIYFGFGLNVSNASQDANGGEALVFTPGTTEQTFTARVVARTSGVIALGLQNNADAGGEIYEFDDITAEREGFAVWADMEFGDGFTVPNLSNPAWDGTIPANSGIVWAYPERGVTSTVRQAADQAVTSSIAPVDTGLTFRVAAGAKYAFRFWVPFTLAGTASGYRFNLTGPAGAVVMASATIHNAAGNSVTEAQAYAAFPMLINGSLASANTHYLEITGTVENGATEGPITLQMGQQTSDPGAITVEQDSTAAFTRIS